MSTGRRACAAATCAASSASRSAAAKSVASSTRCTNVPTCAPTGMPASSEGVARSASSGSTGAAGAHGHRRLVVHDRLLRLARHARLVRAGGDVAVRRPPPAPVELAVEPRGGQLRGSVREAAPRHRQPERRPLDADAARRLRRERLEPRGRLRVGERATARPVHRAVLVAGEQQPPERRMAAVDDPAHQITAWCCARVSATYASRRSSPRCSIRCWRLCWKYSGPSSPTSIVRASPRSGSWKVTGTLSSGSTSAPTGRGSRRPGTRGPCCGGS